MGSREVARLGTVDVVVVGASIAGCTTAVLLARSGCRVALVERRADPQAFKTVCTHIIQSSAVPTICRLGVLEELERAGAVRTGGDFWTAAGWVRPPRNTDEVYSLNLRREKLDPILRQLATDTDGVDLLMGERVEEVLRDGARVVGVATATPDGQRRELRARLVVAADGRRSTVAAEAGIPTRLSPNGRFGYWAYYRDIPLTSGSWAQLWFLDPDMVYAFPTDSDLTLIACMPTKARLADFKSDAEARFLEMVRSVPDAPAIDSGTRVSQLLGKLDTPNLSRSAAPNSAPGLALIGDAALGFDPLWGVGCGFAFQSGEWLADAVAGPLRDGTDVQRALRRYARRHRARLLPYDLISRSYSTGRRFNAGERMVYAAAAQDPWLASRADAFGTRNLTVAQFLTPRTLGRAVRVTATRARRRRRADRVASTRRTTGIFRRDP